MSGIKKIEAYETEDGVVHHTLEEAEAHRVFVMFQAYYEDNTCYGNYAGIRVDTEDMMNWLKEHKEMVMAFLEGQR